MVELGLALSALAVLGTLALTTQWVALWRHCHLTRPPASPLPQDLPGISVLKPLCGLDEDLEDNLHSFARLDYPRGRYEVLLGVRDLDDAAYPLAREMARRHPDTFRLLLQQGEPGLNPKVNQLITLERHARFPLVVVSDSNVRAVPDYLTEIASHFVAPDVGCVTHPVAGCGERSWGALLDNLHLSSSVGPGMVAAQRVAGRDLVVGKSMALWRNDLQRLGGFLAVKDHLAEDHVLGNRVSQELGKRVVVSSRPIFNVAARKSVRDFFRRYRRWAVIHRTAVPPTTYLAQALLNPVPLALAGWGLAQTRLTLGALLVVFVAKIVIDLTCLQILRGDRGGGRAVLAIPLKDALLFFAWFHGLFARTVDWRGNRLRVAAGSRLIPAEALSFP